MYIALILMSVLAFTQVITRYILQIPTVWIEETTRYLMIWLIFIGMAIAVRTKGHLEVEVMSFFFPSISKYVLQFFEVIMLIFAIIFSMLSLQMVSFQWEMGQTSPAMQVPMAVVYMGMLIGGVLMIIHSFLRVYIGFRSFADKAV